MELVDIPPVMVVDRTFKVYTHWKGLTEKSVVKANLKKICLLPIIVIVNDDDFIRLCVCVSELYNKLKHMCYFL